MTFARFRSAAPALVLLAAALVPGAVAAEPDRVAFGSSRCASLAWRQLAFESNAVWLGPALAGALLAADSPSNARWKGGILFDSDLRDELASGTKKGRNDAGDTGNVLLGVTLALPVLDIVWRLKDPDCDSTTDLASDFVESILFTMLVERGTKLVSARERPRGGGIKSFFSGHASLTGTAAGLVCANAFRKQMWGERWYTRALPCALTSALATTTGVYRLKSDSHWGTDVWVGLLFGFASGFFDLPNAAAWLHEPLGVRWLRERTGIDSARLAPAVEDGAFGLRLAVRY